MKNIIKKLIIRRLETFYITPWWMKRAYYDVQSDKMVMVAVPLNYVVEIAWRINLKWGEYRHKPTWLDAIIKQRDETRIVTGDTSDGFHTFNDLYEHRCTLFLALMASNPNMSWASAKHFDGSSFDGWFVAGMELPTGDVTYHLPDSMWEMAKKTGACIMDRGKEWDGHSAADVVERIQKWVKEEAREALKAFKLNKKHLCDSHRDMLGNCIVCQMGGAKSTRNFSQAGYAIVENRIRGLPITLGFDLAKWEAEASMGKLRAKVGNEFYQDLQVVCATLTFSVQENCDAELDQLKEETETKRQLDEAERKLSRIYRWVEKHNQDGFIDSLTHVQNIDLCFDSLCDKLEIAERQKNRAIKHLAEMEKAK